MPDAERCQNHRDMASKKQSEDITRFTDFQNKFYFPKQPLLLLYHSSKIQRSATLRELKTRYVSLMGIWPSKGDNNPLDSRHTLTLMLAWFCVKALTGVGVVLGACTNWDFLWCPWEILLPTVQEFRRNNLWVFFTLLWMGLQYSALDGSRVVNSSHFM